MIPADGEARRQRLLVIAISASLLGSMMSASVFGLALSEIARGLDVGFATFRWRNIVYWSVLAVGMPFFGRLVDRGDPRRHLLAGVALYSAAIAATGLSQSFGALVLFQAIQGLADAVLFPAQSALIRRVVPPGRVGWAFGWQTAVLAAGTLIGPLAGGLLLMAFDWRVPFLFLALVGVASFAFAVRVLPRRVERGSGQGRGLPVATTLGLLAAFLSLQAALALEQATLGLAFLASAIVCAGFVRLRERRGPAGTTLLPAGLWHNPIFLLTAVRSLFGNLGIDSVVTFGPSFLSEVHGMGPGSIGVILLLSPLCVVLLAGPAGRLADRRSAVCVVGGLALTAGGLLLLAALPAGAPFPPFAGAAALIGAGIALFMPAQNRLAFLAVPESETGSYMAVFQMISLLSGGFAGAAFGRLIAEGDGTHVSAAGFQTTLVACAAVALVGAMTLLVHRRASARAAAPALDPVT